MQLAPLQLASESELLRRDSRDRAGFMLIAMGLILVLTALVGGGLVLPDLQVGAAHETEPAPLPTSPIGTKAPTLPRPVASQTPTSSPQVQPSPADAAPPAAAAPGPVHLIIDTDLSFDVDDVGAVCIAHELARRGEVRIEAIVHDSGLPLGAGALSSLSAFYGANVPLGAYKGTFGVDRSGRWIEGPYVRALVEAFPTDVVDSSGVPTAVDVLRAALAGAAAPVTIAAIGFATNLAALLRSSPDKHSSLSGRELVEQKVAQVVWQGGWYEPLHPNGHTTFNWDCGHDSGYDTSLGCAGDAGFAVANMPSTVDQIFSDLGDDVYAAARLKPLTRRTRLLLMRSRPTPEQMARRCAQHLRGRDQPMSPGLPGHPRARPQSAVVGSNRRARGCPWRCGSRCSQGGPGRVQPRGRRGRKHMEPGEQQHLEHDLEAEPPGVERRVSLGRSAQDGGRGD